MEETTAISRTLVRAHLANAVGDGAFYVTAVVAFSRLHGLDAVAIGAVLTLAWTLGAAVVTWAGRLADRWGLRGSAVAFSLLTAGSVGGLGWLSPAWLLAGALCVYAVAQSGSSAVRQALVVAYVEPGQRTLVRARIQAAVNGGIGGGAVVGGLAIHLDSATAYRAVFLLDAAAFVLSAVVMARLPMVRARVPLRTGGALPVWRDRRYVVATAANGVLMLYMPLLSVVLPLYVATRTAAPAWSVAGLFVVNTAGVVLLQVRAARSVRDLRGAGRSVRRGGWLFLGACAALSWADAPAAAYPALAVLAAGALLQVAGEVLVTSGSWRIGFDLADPARPGEWQGFYGAGVPAARAVGPLALTWLVLTWTGPGWLVLGLVFVAASAALAAAGGRRTGHPARGGTIDPGDSGGPLASLGSEVGADELSTIRRGRPGGGPRAAADRVRRRREHR